MKTVKYHILRCSTLRKS